MDKRIIFLIVGLILINFVSAFSWSDNMYQYWSMDDNNANTTVHASVGTTGVLNGGSNTEDVTATGKVGSSLTFNGVGADYASIATSLNLGSDFTVNLWIYPTNLALGQQNLFNTVTSNYIQIIANDAVTNGIRTNIDGTLYTTAENVLSDNNWYMITVVHNQGVSSKTYINGKLNGSQTISASGNGTTIWIGNYGGDKPFSGRIDEVGVWTKALSQADIDYLYNSGSGIAYSATPAHDNVTLEAPTNDSTITAISYNFTVSGNVSSIAEFNATSLTFFVWNATDNSIFNSTNVSLAGTSSFYNQSLVINTFTLGSYIWNAKVCFDDGASETHCVFNENNFTFTINPFSVVSETYPSTTVEGSTDTFKINLSFLSGYRLSTLNFVYNNTLTNVDFTEYATNYYSATLTRQAPFVPSNTNITFYWNLSLESGTLINSTLHNQTIYDVTVDNCTTGTYRLFNFTLVDEDTQTKLVGASDNTSIRIELLFSTLTGTQIPLNFTSLYTGVNPARICSTTALGNSRYRVDGVIEYQARGRFKEFYNIQNYTLTNSTDDQNITLYNLNSTTGQEFKITYKDENFNLVPGAIIQIQRKYIDEGVFKTVEIPKIGSAGYTIAHLIRNDIYYNLVILKEGRVLATFSDIVAACQNPAISDCEININSFTSNVPPSSFTTNLDFTSTLSYNETTKIISSIFAISSGVPATVTLNATLFDSLGNRTICSDTLMAAGGTLSCTVPSSFTNSTVVVKIYVNNVIRKTGVLKLGKNSPQLYGNNLVFIALSIILLLIGIGITDNPQVLGILLVFGVFLLGVLNVINNFAWIGSGASVLWFVVAIVIILIKGSNRQ